MQLFINEKNISFKIGNEKNAADVVASLNIFANEKTLIVSEIKINDVEVSPYDSSLTNMPINGIAKIHCTLENPSTYAASMLFEITKRLTVFTKKYTRDDILQNFVDIENRLNWVQEVLKKSGNLLKQNDALLPIEAQVQGLRLLAYGVKNEEKQWDENAAASLANKISHNIESLRLRVAVYVYKSILARVDTTSVDCLEATCTLLQQTQAECEKIAIDFQSGNPLDGLARIVALVDSIEILQNGCKHLIQLQPNLKNAAGEIHFDDVLKQLEEIKTLLEEENYVELSDIVEYELQPALASLSSHFQSLSAEIH